MSAQGRDYGRFAYMNKLHAFTEERKQAILAERRTALTPASSRCCTPGSRKRDSASPSVRVAVPKSDGAALAPVIERSAAAGRPKLPNDKTSGRDGHGGDGSGHRGAGEREARRRGRLRRRAHPLDGGRRRRAGGAAARLHQLLRRRLVRQWRRQGAGADHRVIGIDARGHGRSEKPHDPAKYPGDQMPADVIEVLDHLGVGKAHFHGYSMGGGIVAHLLARHPDRFITASFGGSGVREEDEALADAGRRASIRKGHDPQQDGGPADAARARRPRRRGAEVRAGRPPRQPSTAPPLDLDRDRLPDPGDQRRVRRADLQDPAAGARGEGLHRVILPGRGHNTVTTWPFTPRLYIDVDRRLRPRPRSEVATGADS